MGRGDRAGVLYAVPRTPGRKRTARANEGDEQ